MHDKESVTQGEKVSMQEAIDWVRQERNHTIKQFLNNEHTATFFKETFGIGISKIKFEFLSRDLGELLISPVDLVHYASVLTDMTAAPWESPATKLHHLVMADLHPLFKKYTY